jgi:hypothetical protein
MDRVRFGRALGFGARQAMKTLVTAVDAATADNPSAAKTAPNGTSRPSASPSPASAAPSRAPAQAQSQTQSQSRQTKQRLGRSSKRFGHVAWEPFVRLSGVLWLEVTGVFFGLFALVALGHLWKLRAAWQADAASRHSLIGAAIVFVLFGYFCVSSFLRARRRERKR